MIFFRWHFLKVSFGAFLTKIHHWNFHKKNCWVIVSGTVLSPSMRPGVLAKMLESKPSRERRGGGEGRGAQRQGACNCKQGRAGGRQPWDLWGGIQSSAHNAVKVLWKGSGSTRARDLLNVEYWSTPQSKKLAMMVVVRGQDGMHIMGFHALGGKETTEPLPLLMPQNF